MVLLYKYLNILFLCSFLFLQEKDVEILSKTYHPSGKIDAIIQNKDSDDLILVQLDLINDSLVTLANDLLPQLELYSGAASYHRIMKNQHLEQIKLGLSNKFYKIIDSNYQFPDQTRQYWVNVIEGSNTLGTWSEDDAIEYTCDCLNGASDCVKLGWDESWYNPFDYWGEAWYGFQPPYYESIDEIRVTVTGAQCDDLPLWSETFMGMMDGNGNWSQDYELSINYTDNTYIVGNILNNSIFSPRIGSEDNYCIDKMKLELFYTCNDPENATNLLASDQQDCYVINLNWSLPTSNLTHQIIYRDNTIIAQLNGDVNQYEDWGAESGFEHIYCIETYNECGNSALTCNPGSLKVVPLEPNDVNASDGEYIDQIIITWTEVQGADHYKIYRDESWIGIVSEEQLEYIDMIPEMDVSHEYCIESVNDCGSSLLTCDIGFIQMPLGDINSDGIYNVLDVIVLLNFVMEITIPSSEEFLIADINYDDILNILDIVMLVDIILVN